MILQDLFQRGQIIGNLFSDLGNHQHPGKGESAQVGIPAEDDPCASGDRFEFEAAPAGDRPGFDAVGTFRMRFVVGNNALGFDFPPEKAVQASVGGARPDGTR